MIKEKWIYPCIPNSATRQCEYKSAQLEIEFGIARDGRVAFVIVRQGFTVKAPGPEPSWRESVESQRALFSQYGIYAEYAINAIKLASPFPRLPDEMGEKGIPILARFLYIVDGGKTSQDLK